MKWILSAVLLLGAFLAGLYIGSSSQPDVVLTPDVKPSKQAVVKQPQSNQDYMDAFNAPMSHKSKYDQSTGIYSATVTDGFKSYTFFDRLTVKPKKNLMLGGVGVDSSLRLTYSLGYLRNVYFDGLYVGCIASFNSSSFLSLSVVAALQF